MCLTAYDNENQPISVPELLFIIIKIAQDITKLTKLFSIFLDYSAVKVPIL